jgi:hypothetical protein
MLMLVKKEYLCAEFSHRVSSVLHVASSNNQNLNIHSVLFFSVPQ